LANILLHRRASLARCDHTVTVIGKKAYIFGGRTSPDQLATNDIHCIALPIKDAPKPEYQAIPAVPANGHGEVPEARAQHAACALGKYIAVCGGCDETDAQVDDMETKLWLFDTEKLTWEVLEPSSHLERRPPSRRMATLLSHDGNLILYGGVGAQAHISTQVWHFDRRAKVWNQLPDAPVAVTSAAITGDSLYLVAASDSLSSEVHRLDIKLYDEKPPTWSTVSIPTNPLTPGPKLRANGALLPVTTGYGRNFLVYFFGEHLGNAAENSLRQWSDIWTFQLSSSDIEVKATTTMTDVIKPAKIKDQIRSKLGVDTGTASWAEVEVQVPGDLKGHEGKVHPGPRSLFGYDVTPDKKGVVLWGGISADGKMKGDGWMIELV
jgi:hypothetical protein